MPYRLHLFTGGQYRIRGVSRTACGFCRGGYQPPAVTPHRVCSGTQTHLILRKYRNRSLRRAAAITVRHRSRGFRAGRICQGIRRTPLGPGPQARHWHQIVSPEQRVTVGKEAQGSGREMAVRPFRVKRTLCRRSCFPSLESSPPAGGTTLKTKQGVRRCGGEFPLQRCKREQKNAAVGRSALPNGLISPRAGRRSGTARCEPRRQRPGCPSVSARC